MGDGRVGICVTFQFLVAPAGIAEIVLPIIGIDRRLVELVAPEEFLNGVG
jgi:hypothetical protein